MGIFDSVKAMSEHTKAAKEMKKKGGSLYGTALGEYLGGHPDFALKSKCSVYVNKLGIIFDPSGSYSFSISADQIIACKISAASKNVIELAFYYNNVPVTISFESKNNSMLIGGINKLRSETLNMGNRRTEDNLSSTGSTTDIPGQIKKLSELKEQGILTDEEFAAKKTELLSRM